FIRLWRWSSGATRPPYPPRRKNGAVRGHVDTTVSIHHATCDRERRTTVEDRGTQGLGMPIVDPQLLADHVHARPRPPPRHRRRGSSAPALSRIPFAHAVTASRTVTRARRSVASIATRARPILSVLHRPRPTAPVRFAARRPRVAPRAAARTVCTRPRPEMLRVVPPTYARNGGGVDVKVRSARVAGSCGVPIHIAQEGGQTHQVSPRRLRAVRPARARGGRRSRAAKRASAVVPRIAEASGGSTGRIGGWSDSEAKGTGCGADDGEQGRLEPVRPCLQLPGAGGDGGGHVEDGLERKSAGVCLALRRALALAMCMRGEDKDEDESRGSKAAFRGFLMDVHCHCFFDRRLQAAGSAR
ncbi:hypothetical protein B0H15DRAFT_869769, partial [Mycena belliarum]